MAEAASALPSRRVECRMRSLPVDRDVMDSEAEDGISGMHHSSSEDAVPQAGHTRCECDPLRRSPDSFHPGRGAAPQLRLRALRRSFRELANPQRPRSSEMK